MKKVICLLLISVICFSLFGCSVSPMQETWSNFAEYDGVGFDIEEYSARVESNGGDVELLPSTEYNLFGEIIPEARYFIEYADETGFPIAIFESIDDAKVAHGYVKEEYAFMKVDNPYVVAIRIDNAVIFGLSEENNRKIIEFANEIGISDEQINLQKNNQHWRIARRDTDKTKENILKSIENKGYTAIDEYVSESNDEGIYLKSTTYVFASEDYSTVYQLYVTEGENARAYLYTTMVYYPEFFNIKQNKCHIYYSINDGYSMFILGVSADTKDFWDEIR